MEEQGIAYNLGRIVAIVFLIYLLVRFWKIRIKQKNPAASFASVACE